MKTDKTLRANITNIATLALVASCLIGYIFGWIDPSPLVCPDDSRLTLQSRNVEILRNGTYQTHTVSGFDCVDTHGISVSNNADMTFGLVCALPFFLLMAWGIASNLLGNKKKQGLESQKGNRKQVRTLTSNNNELEKYFRFTPDDLTRNKNGLVSESQKRELQRKRLDKAFRTLIFPALIVLVLLAILRLKGGMMLLPVLALYLPLVFAVIIGIIFFPVFKKVDFSLKSVQGKVNLVRVFKTTGVEAGAESENWDAQHRQENKTVMITEMRVGGKTFSTNDALLEIVHQGDMCNIYYIGSGDIVSMEFLL